MARDRFDRGDHFLVGDFVGRTNEARVAAVHEDGTILLGIASQRRDQLPSFRVVEWTEIHRGSPFQKKATPKQSVILRCYFRKQQVNRSVNAGLLGINAEGLAVSQPVIHRFPSLKDNPQGLVGVGQRHPGSQSRPSISHNHFKSDAGLLPAKAVETVRVTLDHRPDSVQWPCQIRP
jgi:hypothetical protein